MPRGFNSLAEYYRWHRQCFELALATGCTPKEAERELRRQTIRRRAVCGTHAEAASAEARPSTQPTGDFLRWDAPHMMRD